MVVRGAAEAVWKTYRVRLQMEEHTMATTKRKDDRLPAVRSRAQVVPEGRLPLTELTFDRAGAASPFGDDLAFPMPISELTYVHPHPDTAPQHL
jgi:hypothetical protein